MKTNTMTTSAAAALLLALPGCGHSSPPKGHGGASASRTPEEVAQSAPYRIAGAGLMMTPDQVATALRAQGYQPTRDTTMSASWLTDSFDDLVQYRLTGHAPEHPRRVPTHQEWAKGHEMVTVQYAVYPGDPKAILIDWKTDDGSPSEAEIRATLTKRYGPGFQLKSFLPPQWCSPAPCSPNSAVLTASPSGIGLSGPDVLGQPISFNQRMDAAVRAHDGATKGSF